MKINGFYVYAYGSDCFIKTDAKNRTSSVALDFINKLQNKVNDFSNVTPAMIEWFKNRMRPAVLEIRTLADGSKYINIHGENFGGCGPEGFFDTDAAALEAMLYVER